MAASRKSATSSKSQKEHPASEEIIDGEIRQPSQAKKHTASKDQFKGNKKPDNQRQNGGRLSVVALLLSGVAMAGSGFLYLENQRLQQDITALTSQIPAANMLAKLEEQATDLAQNQAAIAKQQRALSETLMTLKDGYDAQLFALRNQDETNRAQLQSQISALDERHSELAQNGASFGETDSNLKARDISQIMLTQLYAHAQMGLDLSSWPARLDALPAFTNTTPSYGTLLSAQILSSHAQILGQGEALLNQINQRTQGEAVSGLSGVWQKLAGLVRLQSLDSPKPRSDERGTYQAAYQEAVLANDLSGAIALMTSVKQDLAGDDAVIEKELADWLARATSRQRADSLIQEWYLASIQATAPAVKGQNQ